MIVNVSEAKTHLSKLINLAFQGEEVIIAKNNLPLVELVVHKPKSKIVFGLLSTNVNGYQNPHNPGEFSLGGLTNLNLN